MASEARWPGCTERLLLLQVWMGARPKHCHRADPLGSPVEILAAAPGWAVASVVIGLNGGVIVLMVFGGMSEEARDGKFDGKNGAAKYRAYLLSAMGFLVSRLGWQLSSGAEASCANVT
jgi:hypothetical protein